MANPFQFRLRTIFVLVAVLCTLLAGWVEFHQDWPLIWPFAVWKKEGVDGKFDYVDTYWSNGSVTRQWIGDKTRVPEN